MKDYRSLEQKIRQMRIDEAEARNTALRKKVENVGRPKDDNKDPETSKLAKQGEIKTKIIDEAAPKQVQIQNMEKVDKKSNMSDMNTREIKGGKTEVVLDPKTDDRPQEQTMEDEKSKKAAKKVNKEQSTKGTIVKEEALDELSKETLRSYKEKSSMPKKDEQPRQSMNRMVGMARAMRRIHAKDHGINYNAEEVKSIDEGNPANKEKNWIAGAIKHKGALHKQLHVPADEPIPAEKLNAAAEKGGKLGKRARLAKTLKRIVKEK